MTARMPLTPSQLQELWLGPSYVSGSKFADREELEAAWREHSAEVMTMSKPGQRPAAWWEFDAPTGLKFDADHEQSILWRAGVLGAEERREVEAEWRREFEHGFTRSYDAKRRKEHFRWADIPRELVKAWLAERRRHRKTIRKLETENASAAMEELRRR
jgi:hypothetical protein